MREEQYSPYAQCCYTGITPACAGRTCVVGGKNGRFKDHPRVCGKNLELDWGEDGKIGSPPRVREEPEFSLE